MPTSSKHTSPHKSASASTPPPAKRRRLAPEAREKEILDAAVSFFAQHGFDASTRDLAKALNITQPLLYRYFPSKEALVSRVEEVFAKQWVPHWEALIADRSQPLRNRLQTLFKDYAAFVLESDWVRLFIYAGLSGSGIHIRYMARMREQHFEPIARELRHEYGLPEPRNQEEIDEEVELAWSLHASVFYIGIRKWVYGVHIPADLSRSIDMKVDAYLAGASTVIKQRNAAKPSARIRKKP